MTPDFELEYEPVDPDLWQPDRAPLRIRLRRRGLPTASSDDRLVSDATDDVSVPGETSGGPSNADQWPTNSAFAAAAQGLLDSPNPFAPPFVNSFPAPFPNAQTQPWAAGAAAPRNAAIPPGNWQVFPGGGVPATAWQQLSMSPNGQVSLPRIPFAAPLATAFGAPFATPFASTQPQIPRVAMAMAAARAPASLGASSAGLYWFLPRTNHPGDQDMPNVLEAGRQGLLSGIDQLRQTLNVRSGAQPGVEESPAARPFAWSDLTSPLSQGAPKVAFRLAQSSPTLAGGVGGGIAGGALGGLGGPVGAAIGTIGGGALGTAALSAAQTLGPAFHAELQRTPDDPEGAWRRAVRQAEISGAFSGAGWALFPVRFFQGPVKQLVFQTFGVQPALAVGEQATRLSPGRISPRDG
jgi:hypothetical protein